MMLRTHRSAFSLLPSIPLSLVHAIARGDAACMSSTIKTLTSALFRGTSAAAPASSKQCKTGPCSTATEKERGRPLSLSSSSVVWHSDLHRRRHSQSRPRDRCAARTRSMARGTAIKNRAMASLSSLEEYFDVGEAFYTPPQPLRADSLVANAQTERVRSEDVLSIETEEDMIMKDALIHEIVKLNRQTYYADPDSRRPIRRRGGEAREREMADLDPRAVFVKSLDTGQHASLGQVATAESHRATSPDARQEPVSDIPDHRSVRSDELPTKKGRVSKLMRNIKRLLMVKPKTTLGHPAKNPAASAVAIRVEEDALPADGDDATKPTAVDAGHEASPQDGDSDSLDSMRTASDSASSIHSLRGRIKSKVTSLFRRKASLQHDVFSYVKVKLHKKDKGEIDSLILVQDLSESPHQSSSYGASLGRVELIANTAAHPRIVQSPVWALKFSNDGLFLSAGCKSGTLYLWEVIQQPMAAPDQRLLQILQSEPLMVLEGHTADILEISWSKNNFILTSSTDKTIRLWHPSKLKHLSVFEHPDYATSVAFHPTDDRFFISGCIDGYLRLWNIRDRSCIMSRFIPDELITAVAFASHGKISMAGTLGGKCYFYETHNLKYNTQFQIHSGNQKHKKINGLESLSITSGTANEKIIVTSSDCNVRIYNLRDKSLAAQFKGIKISNSFIKARASDDGEFIICGSEDSRILIWNNLIEEESVTPDMVFESLPLEAENDAADKGHPHEKHLDFHKLSAFGVRLPHLSNPLKAEKMKHLLSAAFRRDRPNRYEYFKAHEDRVTAAIFGPASLCKYVQSLCGAGALVKQDFSQELVIVSADVQGHIKVFLNGYRRSDAAARMAPAQA